MHFGNKVEPLDSLSVFVYEEPYQVSKAKFRYIVRYI